MNLWFTAIYVILGLALLITELVGVWRKGDGDTITENWRWVRKNAPPWLGWAWGIFTGGLLIWALGHFLGGWD